MSAKSFSSQSSVKSQQNLYDTINNALSPKDIKDPRKESFWDMIYINLFPHLQVLTFSFIFSMILLLIFILQIFLSNGINMLGNFLEVKHEFITEIMLLEKSIYLHMGKKYRIISSMFIHGDIPQLSITIILLWVWGSSLEYQIGALRTGLIWFLSSLFGNYYGLMKSKILEEVILGADAGVFGLLGAAFGYVILNWNKIKQPVILKLMLFFTIAIIFLFGFIFASSYTNLYKQLGGCFAGVLLGACLSPVIGQQNSLDFSKVTPYEIIIMIAGAVSYVLLILPAIILV